MRRVTAQKAGSIESVLLAAFPRLPRQMLMRALKQRDVKRDGVRLGAGARVQAGDALDVYIADEWLFPADAGIEIVYEDARILVVNKPAGVSVTPDDGGGETLGDRLARVFEARGEDATPLPCHRLDHNTGGVLLYAKDEAALDALILAFREHRVEKTYHCLTRGTPVPGEATLRAFCLKDAKAGVMRVLDRPAPGCREMITRYRVIRPGTVALVEVMPVTGRTHQIRAHMAHIGHPLLGDDKYGDRALNREHHMRVQQLFACRLRLRIPDGPLAYLDGKTFSLDSPFME